MMHDRIRYLKDEFSFREEVDMTKIKPEVLKCYKGKRVTFYEVLECYTTMLRIRKKDANTAKSVSIKELLNLYDKVVYINSAHYDLYNNRGMYKKISNELWHPMNDTIMRRRLFDMLLLNSKTNREAGYYVYDKYTKKLLICYPEGALGLDDAPEMSMRVIDRLSKHDVHVMPSAEVFRACDFGTPLSEHRYCFYGCVKAPDVSAIIAVDEYHNWSSLCRATEGDNYHEPLSKCEFKIDPENGELIFTPNLKLEDL